MPHNPFRKHGSRPTVVHGSDVTSVRRDYHSSRPATEAPPSTHRSNSSRGGSDRHRETALDPRRTSTVNQHSSHPDSTLKRTRTVGPSSRPTIIRDYEVEEVESSNSDSDDDDRDDDRDDRHDSWSNTHSHSNNGNYSHGQTSDDSDDDFRGDRRHDSVLKPNAHSGNHRRSHSRRSPPANNQLVPVRNKSTRNKSTRNSIGSSFMNALVSNETVRPKVHHADSHDRERGMTRNPSRRPQGMHTVFEEDTVYVHHRVKKYYEPDSGYGRGDHDADNGWYYDTDRSY